MCVGPGLTAATSNSASRCNIPSIAKQAANPANLAAAVAPLLADTPARRAQCDAFAVIRSALGDGRAVEHTARLILETAGLCAANDTAPLNRPVS